MQNRYEAKNLVWKVADNKILDDITVTFNAGLNVIIGESGAGKSSLLNMLGLIDIPDDGDILYNESSVNCMSLDDKEKFRADKIGFIFQQNNLISDMTVKENIEIAMEINAVHGYDYGEIFSRLKITELLNKKVCFLSGGEQQRVAIARALLKDAEIILADEPTGNLDKANSDIVFGALKECATKYGKIVIVVTHDKALASKYANYLVELEDGKVIENTIIEQIQEVKICNSDKAESGLEGEKKGLSLKTKMQLGLKYFKRRPKRTFAISVITALTIAIGATAFYINNQTENMFDSMNTDYLETDLVQIYSKDTQRTNQTQYGYVLSNEDIETIENAEEFVQVTDFVNMGLIAATYDGKDILSSVDMMNVRYIDIDEFYKNRIMKNDIEGRFIENEKEVILGKDVCDELFIEENPIGKTIKLMYSNSYIEVEIVGVNSTQNVEGHYISYIPASITFELAKGNIESFASIDIKDNYEAQTTIYTGGSTGSYGYREDYELMKGVYPTDIDEVAIDTMLAEVLMKEIKKDSIINQQVYITINYPKLYKIVGVYDSDAKQMIYFNNNIKEELSNCKATSVYAYLKDVSDISKFEKSKINQNYTCGMIYKYLIGTVSDKTRNIRSVLLFLATAFVVISFAVINTLVGISIKERTYEIGVLRALGGSRKDLKLVYSLECIFIGVVSSVLGIVLFQLSKLFVNQIILERASYNMGMLDVYVVVLTFLLVVIAGQVPIRKIVKMKPIDCIRKK